jgi:hypothetical protein
VDYETLRGLGTPYVIIESRARAIAESFFALSAAEDLNHLAAPEAITAVIS